MNRAWLVPLAVVMAAASCGDDEESSREATEDTAAPAGQDQHGDHGGGHGSGQATCEPQGTSLALTAQNITLNTDCLAAPANQAVTIRYESKDSVTHNLAILESHTSPEPLFRGDLFQAPKTTTSSVPALRPGTYAFHCEVHPSQMQGTFVVK